MTSVPVAQAVVSNMHAVLYIRHTLCCVIVLGVMIVTVSFTSTFHHRARVTQPMATSETTTAMKVPHRDVRQQHTDDTHIIVHDWLAHTKTERQAAVKSSLFTHDDICSLMPVYRPSAQCRDLDRLGELGDGGKWVCGMHGALDHRRVVYSFGSNYQVSAVLDIDGSVIRVGISAITIGRQAPALPRAFMHESDLILPTFITDWL